MLADLAGAWKFKADFFERVRQPADVLLMKNVLHDWSDEKCQVILDLCQRLASRHSRLLIVERGY